VVDSISPLRAIDCRHAAELPLEELLEQGTPAVLKGVAEQWGLVAAGRRSIAQAMAYLRGFDVGKPVQYSYGDRSIGGRPFYNADFTELNFEVRRDRLSRVLEEIDAHLEESPSPAYYIASLLVDGALPGFSRENDLALAQHGIDAPASIWIGNRVVASCHFDEPNNLAVCAAGRRQFTLFAPEQIGNLYPGPLEPTPGGQVVSLVDFDNPDYERYPRFREALAGAQTAILEPGDAVFIPGLWWHHVRSLEPFNVLVNYWWRSSPAFLSSPLPALHHALWTLRDLPDREKRAWAAVFDYYVFGPKDRAGEHLPEKARDVLGPIDENLARRMRAMLLGRLNR